MVRWLQLLFGLIALLTVVDFETHLAFNVECINNNVTTTNANITLDVSYPFDFSQQVLESPCSKTQYIHRNSLTSSPQFFVMSGSLSIIFTIATLVLYLLFSSLYHSMPLLPVIDLTLTGLLALFWLISSITFGFGVYLMKNTVSYEVVSQSLCQNITLPLNTTVPANNTIVINSIEVQCQASPDDVSWKSLDVALISGFASFFLWTTGLWFVFKETHFHTPREQFGPN